MHSLLGKLRLSRCFLLSSRDVGTQRGTSLVELMISLTISTVLLLMASTVIVNNRENYAPVRDLVRLNEGATVVLEMLAQDIRLAGFFGENAAPQSVSGSTSVSFNSNSMISRADKLFNLSAGSTVLAIEGYDESLSEWQPTNVSVFDNGDPLTSFIRSNTDAITVRGALAGNDIKAIDPMSVPGNGITVADGSEMPTGFYAVFDTLGTDLFFAQGNRRRLNPERDLSRAYPINQTLAKPAAIAPLNFARYYIGTVNDSGEEVGNSGQGKPALFREYYDPGIGDVVRRVVMPGIENMQITYGVDGIAGAAVDGQIDAFVNASNVPDWSQVYAVRIGLLVRSETESTGIAGASNDQYDVNGTEVDVDGQDRFFRRVFNTTVSIANVF